MISRRETEFELPTGDMDTADVFFNRDAWMGFCSDDLGKPTFGRQNTLTRDFTQTWGDAYGTADVGLKEGGCSNVNNFKQFIYRQLDVCLAGDYFKVDGGWVLGDAQGNGNHFGAGQAYSNETEVAIGARYKF